MPQHEQSHAAASQKSNVAGAAIELNVSMLINRAHLAIQHKRYAAADVLVDGALALAHILAKQPLSARCWFWKGFLADMYGNALLASEAFLNAVACVGHYREGEHLRPYILKYEDIILRLLEKIAPLQGVSAEWIDILKIVGIVALPKSLVEQRSSQAPTHQQQEPRQVSSSSSSTTTTRPPADARNSSASSDESDAIDRLMASLTNRTTREARNAVKPAPRAPPPQQQQPVPGDVASSSTPEQKTLVKPPEVGTPPNKQHWRWSTAEEISEAETLATHPTAENDLNSSPFFKMLSRQILSPIDTHRQEQNTEPSIPSPLRKMSMPGEDPG